MLKYFIRRFILLIPIVFFVMTVVFFVMHVIPGDPTYVMLGENASPEAVQELRKNLKLDDPLWLQYTDFIKGFLELDLGKSIQNGMPVTKLIARVFPYTLDLTVVSTIFGTAIGIPLGILSALKRNTLFDSMSRVISLVGISAPPFFLGICLLLVMGYYLGLFPIVGGGDQGNILERLHYMVLPSLSMGLILAAYVMRMTRSCMLEVIREDYMRTARAKGLGEAVVIYKHGLRNALIPIVTVIANYMGHMLGGAVLIETVYSRPGMGKLLVDAIMARDYPVVQATIIVFAFMVALINLILDLVYTIINPRIKYN